MHWDTVVAQMPFWKNSDMNLILVGEHRCHRLNQHRGLKNVQSVSCGSSRLHCLGLFVAYVVVHQVMGE
jgi:hypothetical protein